MKKNVLIALFGAIFMLWAFQKPLDGDPNYQPDYTQWSQYLGGAERNQYSTLSQITPDNVKSLKVAWSYAAPDSGQMQMNPIIVKNVLYGISAASKVFALDATTGKEIWRYGNAQKTWFSTCRGVAYWAKGSDQRILFTEGTNLVALDANTGKLIPTFGIDGKVDLHTGLPETAKTKMIVSNTPGTIVGNLIVMPVRLGEDINAAAGDIRAFDIITGKLAWSFHTIPHPNEAGYETWQNKNAYKNLEVGGANNWAGMAYDAKLGILYVPTGSAAPDFYGGRRLGKNLYANCLLALDAKTGKRIWHYQTVHHDIWDRDLPAPPNLITVTRNGKKIAAVAQITKQGFVFVFDRRTGKPLFDIKEVPVPASTLDGEIANATQPFPVLPKPYSRQSNQLTEKDISPYAENRDELLADFRAADKRLFNPPSLKPTLLLPGYDGGGEWGGSASDPNEGILYVNSNEMAWILQMSKQDFSKTLSHGQKLYNTNCSSCHQANLSGNPASGFPSLQKVSEKLKREDVMRLITQGKGMMVGFPQLTEQNKNAIIDFLFKTEKQEIENTNTAKTLYETPYKHLGYKKFLDSKGLPAISPPWGQLHAIDLNTGKYRWSVPLGETLALKAKGFPTTGSENYGGPLVTKNGLLFIGATKDGYFRAFDKRTGKILLEVKLPAAAFATPATYQVNGKQYVVIACGGEKLGTPKGNQIVAFALD